MKIWILTDQLPANVTGGVARYVDNYARLLGARGHDVTLIAITPNTYEQAYAPGVRLVGIQQGNPAHTGLLRFPQAQQNLIKHLNTTLLWGGDQSYLLAETTIELLKRLPAPDIIEVQESCALPYFLLQRKLTELGPLQQIPILVHLHTSAFDVWRINNDLIYRLPEYWIGQMEKFGIMAADGLLCPSHYLADHVAKTCNPSLNIDVIRLPSYLPESVSLQSSHPEPRHFIYFGRLEVRKGVLPLLAACDELWAKGEVFKLTLIGNDPNHSFSGETVGAHIRKHYANHIASGLLVLQAPSYSFADLMQHIQKAWAVIVPSLFENFPNTCIEAMALGQVVLASTDGGQAEMIEHDGVNGFLFNWAVPGQLQAQLLRILALSGSEREQIGQRARARIAAMCDPDIIIPQRLAHYQRVIDAHRPKRHFPTTHVAPALDLAAHRVKTQSIEMQNDLLSIVICSHEAGQPLYQLILNALASNYAPKEVLVAYPAQLDLTPLQQRFAQLEVDLSAVKMMPLTADEWVDAANQSQLHEALAHQVSGEFITFWTGIESVALDFCTRAIAVLKQYDNVGLVYAWSETDQASRPIQVAWNAEFPLQLAHNMVPDVIIARRAVVVCPSHVKRSHGAGEVQLRDQERWIEMLERDQIGVCLPHPLIRSVAPEKNPSSLQANLQAMLELTQLKSRHVASFEMHAATLFELSNANGPAYRWRHLGESDGYDEFGRLHALLEQKEQKIQAEITLEQVPSEPPSTAHETEPPQPHVPIGQILVPKDKIYLPVPTRWRDLLRTLIILLPGVFTSRYAKLKRWLGRSTENAPPAQPVSIAPNVTLEQTEMNVPADQVLVPKDKIYLPVPTRWRDLLRTLIILLPGVFTSRYARLKKRLGWPAKNDAPTPAVLVAADPLLPLRQAWEAQPATSMHTYACNYSDALTNVGRYEEAANVLKYTLASHPQEWSDHLLHKRLITNLLSQQGLETALAYYQLRRVDQHTMSIKPDEVFCFFCVRNEAWRLPHFLDYYRKLGVNRFFAIDNNSTDDTLHLLSAQPDVHIWHTVADFWWQGHSGAAWVQLLMQAYAEGHWCINADADELLVYPHCEQIQLPAFCAQLEACGFRAISGVLIEMYSDRAIQATQYEAGKAFIETCPFFDRQYYHKKGAHSGKYSNQPVITGGVRQRVFGEQAACWLNKMPLIKYAKDVFLTSGYHFTSHTPEHIALQGGAVLHFKFMAHTTPNFEQRIQDGEQFASGKETLAMKAVFDQTPNLSFYDKNVSVQYLNSQQLMALGVLRTFDLPSQVETSHFSIKKDAVLALTTNPSVSVVIPTAGKFDITKTLQALTTQSYLAQDIIVVESAGISQSARTFLAQYQNQPDKNPQLRILSEPRPRPNIARNTGIKTSSAQIIALIDDDVIPDKDWLKAFVMILETGLGGSFDGVVGGRVNLCYQTPKPAWCVGLFEKYLAQLDHGESSHLLSANDYLVSASMAFYRSTYDKLGGFSEMEMGWGNQMMNDEHLFLEAAKRQTKGMLYCADAIAAHQIPPHRVTIDYFTKRAHLQGAADIALRYYLDATRSKSNGLAFLKGVMEASYASAQSLDNEGLTEVPLGHEHEFIENLLLMRIAYMNGVRASYKQYFEDAT
ncbi:MAG: glycosyltransferase family 2 protein [Anaerolineae bacterium]|nr:glycosyltransferase family 2 protein [Anaerolineae bacterium]